MRYGLIAGNGKFPFLVVEGARRAGTELAVAAIKEETDPAIEKVADKLTWVGIGQLGKMIRFFKREGVEKAIMAGQVKHVQIFSGALPDVRMLKMLLSLPRRNTDALIGGVAAELAREGIELIDSTYFLQDHLPREGTLTRRAPNERELADIAYGREVARQLAQFDVGQTVVIAERACVAVEAMEGTDATILRAGEIMKSLAAEASTLSRALTVVKIAKPDQDMRFDVPVVGVKTIEVMQQAGATCLAIDAGKCLLLDGNKVTEAANTAGISINSD